MVRSVQEDVASKETGSCGSVYLAGNVNESAFLEHLEHVSGVGCSVALDRDSCVLARLDHCCGAVKVSTLSPSVCLVVAMGVVSGPCFHLLHCLFDFTHCCFLLVVFGEFVRRDQLVAALDVCARCGISVVLDCLQVFLRIRDSSQILVSLQLDEFKVSLDAFFQAVVDSEVILDGCQGSWLVFLLGCEVDALAGPLGSAFQTEVVVILGGQLTFSPSRFQDRLGDDRAMHEDSINVGVLLYALCDLLDESLLFLCDCHLAYLLNKKGSLVAALGACVAYSSGSSDPMFAESVSPSPMMYATTDAPAMMSAVTCVAVFSAPPVATIIIDTNDATAVQSFLLVSFLFQLMFFMMFVLLPR